MKVEKVRIQNFQCIRDSNDLLLDQYITVLVGENESGKSAILRALSHFNQGENFKDVDVSTLSGDIRQRLDTEDLSRDSIEMVSIWITLSEKDKRTLALPEHLGNISTLKITKNLDNQYEVSTSEGELLSSSVFKTGILKLLTYLEKLRHDIKNMYCGQVKRKEPQDYFVFLERQEGEKEADNLILFPENAPDIWDDLEAGDWLQVTKISPDPYGRNRRALNAGLKFEINELLSGFIMEVQSQNPDTPHAFKSFRDGLKILPANHPLRDYLTEKVITDLEGMCKVSLSQNQLKDIEDEILKYIPKFIYLHGIDKISDTSSLSILQLGDLAESDGLLKVLLDAAKLRPDIVLKKENPAERIQILREKSNFISEDLRKYWFKKDITIEFHFLNQDQDIGITVESDGSYDPPSRRSAGLSSYLSIFTKLAQLSNLENIVVLLDDPALHLHPIAQKKMLRLLESHQYQIVIATHLPFMIDPEHLERVRVVKRTIAGSQIEQDWEKVEQGLAPVWGSLMGGFIGMVWLLVEGKKDKQYYEALNKVCKKSGRKYLSSHIVIVPGGGDQLRFVAQALYKRGIFFGAVLDGDKAGRESKRRIIETCNVEPQRIVTLDQIELQTSNPEVEDLFSQTFKNNHSVQSRGLNQVLAALGEDIEAFDEETLNSFEKVFSLVDRALAKLHN